MGHHLNPLSTGLPKNTERSLQNKNVVFSGKVTRMKKENVEFENRVREMEIACRRVMKDYGLTAEEAIGDQYIYDCGSPECEEVLRRLKASQEAEKQNF